MDQWLLSVGTHPGSPVPRVVPFPFPEDQEHAPLMVTEEYQIHSRSLRSFIRRRPVKPQQWPIRQIERLILERRRWAQQYHQAIGHRQGWSWAYDEDSDSDNIIHETVQRRQRIQQRQDEAQQVQRHCQALQRALERERTLDRFIRHHREPSRWTQAYQQAQEQARRRHDRLCRMIREPIQEINQRWQLLQE